jgi:hypothetical protein
LNSWPLKPSNSTSSKLLYNISSNRKINKGYFPILIDISHLINSLNDPSIRDLFTSEWQQFIEEKVNPWFKLFERKLCVQEPTLSHSFAQEEEKMGDKETATPESENPFGKKDDYFNTGMNEDEIFNIGSKDPKDNILEHLGEFEFVDDNKTDIDHFDEKYAEQE